jgi:DNA-binding transcriptional ArsR family regulator
VAELPLSQPSVSQHLKELKTADIIRGNIEGTAICYCINESAIAKILNYFSDLAAQIKTHNTDCC